MPFLFPGLVWLGTLASIPIIIHILNKQRHKKLPWAAMEFLLQAIREESRKVQYRDLILMLLRALACLLLALAVARPVSRLFSGSTGWGTGGKRIVIIVDNSASMSLSSGTETLLEVARRRAMSIVREMPTGTSVSIVEGARPAGLLILGENNLLQVEIVIEDIEQKHSDTDIAGAMRQTLAAIGEHTGTVEVFFVTDFQSRVWITQSEAVNQVLNDMEESRDFYVVPVSFTGARNLAVTDIATDFPVVALDAKFEVEVEVVNGGLKNESNFTIDIIVGGQRVGSEIVSMLGQGESVKRKFLVQAREAGNRVIEAVVNRGRGRLSVDDTRRLVVHAIEGVQVLLVSSGTSDDAFGDNDTDFIDAILNPDIGEDQQSGSFVITKIPASSLSADHIARSDIIVLANVPAIDSSNASALKRHVERGGGLLVFLGDRVNPASYRALCGEPTFLLPAAFGAHIVVEQDEDANEEQQIYLSGEHLDHPWMRFFLPKDMRKYLRVPIKKAFALDIDKGKDAMVAARYESGEVAIAEKRLGLGRSVIVGTTANLEWNDLFREAIGPIIVRRIILSLVPGSDVERVANAADQVVIPILPEERKIPIKLISPDNRVTRISPDVSGDRPVVIPDGNTTAGVYRIRISSVPLRVETFVVNVAPDESQLKSLNDEEAVEIFPSPRFNVLHGDEYLTAGKSLKQSKIGAELWWPVLLAGLIFFITEIVLGRAFTKEAPSLDDVPKLARRRTGIVV